MSKITIEINGQAIEAEQGQMIIEVADEQNIRIPRFCYHKKLSIAANCRMCLVQVEKAPKALPACATPITDGMKVFTRSPLALAAQKAVMEFLLINHPLDCPVCDQGGECELQDISMGYGEGLSQYSEGKRSVSDDNLGPLIETYMTRCIHCTRCVRFGTEISGMRELGLIGRGENTMISTYIKKNVESELSGNIIDICPVGALTNKPFKFKARTWEMRQRPSVATHDCLSSHIYIHERRGEVMRIVPRESESINETWISDRDRYGMFGLQSPDRVLHPQIKVDGVWTQTDWATALAFAVDGLQKTIHEFGEDAIGALISPNESIETLYMFQAWLRAMGIKNIDHRLQACDVSDQQSYPAYPGMNITLPELENADAILLLGSHTRKEQPMLWHRLRKAANNGAAIMAINPVDFDMNLDMKASLIPDHGDLVSALAGVVAAVLEERDADPALKTLLKSVKIHDEHKEIAKQLMSAESPVLFLGALAIHHPHASTLRYLINELATLLGARTGMLSPGANAAGAWLSGCVPHREAGGLSTDKQGLSASDMIQTPRQGYILVNIEPEFDAYNTHDALKAMKQADFVMAIAAVTSADMLEYANVILPAAPFTESAGTYVNVQGDWQSVSAAVNPQGEARPAWKIIRVLADLCHIDEMSAFVTLEDVRAAVEAIVAKGIHQAGAWAAPKHLPTMPKGLIRIAEMPIYAIDNIVRRSRPLQETDDAKWPEGLHIHPDLAAKLSFFTGDLVQVKQEGHQAVLPVVLDTRIPMNCAYVAQGLAASKHLGGGYQPIELERV